MSSKTKTLKEFQESIKRELAGIMQDAFKTFCDDNDVAVVCGDVFCDGMRVNISLAFKFTATDNEIALCIDDKEDEAQVRREMRGEAIMDGLANRRAARASAPKSAPVDGMSKEEAIFREHAEDCGVEPDDFGAVLQFGGRRTAKLVGISPNRRVNCFQLEGPQGGRYIASLDQIESALERWRATKKKN